MQPRGTSRPTTHRTEHYCGVHVFVKGLSNIDPPGARMALIARPGPQTVCPAAPTPAQPTLKFEPEAGGLGPRRHVARPARI